MLQSNFSRPELIVCFHCQGASLELRYPEEKKPVIWCLTCDHLCFRPNSVENVQTVLILLLAQRVDRLEKLVGGSLPAYSVPE